MAYHKSPIAWDKENTTRVALKLNNNTDADILRKLETVDSKQGYIKDLIRADIEREKNASKLE